MSESSSEIAKRFFSGKRAKAFRETKAHRGGAANRPSDMGLGEYWVKIARVGMKETPRKMKVLLEIVGTVVAVLSNECAHKVGEEVQKAYFAESDFFFKEVKAFIASTLDMDVDEVTEENVYEICADDNPLADMVIAVKGIARHGEGKHEGRVFENIYFNGEIEPERLDKELDENVKATYLPYLPEILGVA